MGFQNHQINAVAVIEMTPPSTMVLPAPIAPAQVPTQESYRGNVTCQGPRACYDESKRVGETLCYVFGQTFGVASNIIRPFNVFGPGEDHKDHMASMVHKLALQMSAGERPKLFGPGDQARDQVPVMDVVGCCIAAAGIDNDHEIVPGVYNLGSGRATSFNEIVDALRSALGVNVETEYFEMPPSVRAFYQDFTCADMSETERGLGWTPGIDPQAAMVSKSIGIS